MRSLGSCCRHSHLVWRGPAHVGNTIVLICGQRAPCTGEQRDLLRNTEPVGRGWQTGGPEAAMLGLADFHTSLAGCLSELRDSVSLLVAACGYGAGAKSEVPGSCSDFSVPHPQTISFPWGGCQAPQFPGTRWGHLGGCVCGVSAVGAAV